MKKSQLIELALMITGFVFFYAVVNPVINLIIFGFAYKSNDSYFTSPFPALFNSLLYILIKAACLVILLKYRKQITEWIMLESAPFDFEKKEENV